MKYQLHSQLEQLQLNMISLKGTKLNPFLWQKIYKMSLEQIVVPESKEAIKALIMGTHPKTKTKLNSQIERLPLVKGEII